MSKQTNPLPFAEPGGKYKWLIKWGNFEDQVEFIHYTEEFRGTYAEASHYGAYTAQNDGFSSQDPHFTYRIELIGDYKQK